MQAASSSSRVSGSREAHTASIQALLDGPAAAREFTHPMAGSHVLADAVDRFYTTDVFMHTWDLARAASIDPDLDEDEAERILTEMRPLEPLLRNSGQFGPATPAPDGATAGDRLMAFAGRRV